MMARKLFLLGIMVLLGGNSAAYAEFVDISSKFNRDTIAVSTLEPKGNGYLNAGHVFVTNGFPGAPGGGVNLPGPNGAGFGTLTAGGRTYTFGPYNSPDTIQNNTWIVPIGTTSTLTTSLTKVASIGVLFSAVGFNPIPPLGNGKFIITYDDLTTQEFVWHVADSNGAGAEDGLPPVAIGGNAPNGMDLYQTDEGKFSGINNRRWFFQNFTGLDTSKTVVGIGFSATGFGDNGNNAEFGIYAIDVSTVPEPSSMALLGIAAVGAAGMFRRWRRKTSA